MCDNLVHDFHAFAGPSKDIGGRSSRGEAESKYCMGSVRLERGVCFDYDTSECRSSGECGRILLLLLHSAIFSTLSAAISSINE